MENEVDAQIREIKNQFDYVAGDYPVEWIVNQQERFDAYRFRQRCEWLDQYKNLFLESLFLDLPTPFMVFANCNDDRIKIIDGVLRIKTIIAFTDNRFRLSGLDTLTKLNGLIYGDLTTPQRRKFLTKSLRVVIIKENVPENLWEDLHHRLNLTGFIL